MIVCPATVGFGIFAQRLLSTILIAPMVFIALGLVLSVTGLVSEHDSHALLHPVAEVMFVALLFLDAAQIDLAALRKRHVWPVRMLGSFSERWSALRLCPVGRLSLWRSWLRYLRQRMPLWDRLWRATQTCRSVPLTRLFFGWFEPRGLATAPFALLILEQIPESYGDATVHTESQPPLWPFAMDEKSLTWVPEAKC